MPIYALGSQAPRIDPSAYVHPDAVRSYVARAQRYRRELRLLG